MLRRYNMIIYYVGWATSEFTLAECYIKCE